MGGKEVKTSADLLYELIYDWLEVNPMTISDLILVFEEIKFEQLMADDVQDG